MDWPLASCRARLGAGGGYRVPGARTGGGAFGMQYRIA